MIQYFLMQNWSNKIQFHHIIWENAIFQLLHRQKLSCRATIRVACTQRFCTMICIRVFTCTLIMFSTASCNTEEIIYISLLVGRRRSLSAFLWVNYRNFQVRNWFELDFSIFFNLNKYNVTQINWTGRVTRPANR